MSGLHFRQAGLAGLQFCGGDLLGHFFGLSGAFQQAACGETGFDELHVGIGQFEKVLNRSLDPAGLSTRPFSSVFLLLHNGLIFCDRCR